MTSLHMMTLILGIIQDSMLTMSIFYEVKNHVLWAWFFDLYFGCF